MITRPNKTTSTQSVSYHTWMQEVPSCSPAANHASTPYYEGVQPCHSHYSLDLKTRPARSPTGLGVAREVGDAGPPSGPGHDAPRTSWPHGTASSGPKEAPDGRKGGRGAHAAPGGRPAGDSSRGREHARYFTARHQLVPGPAGRCEMHDGREKG